MKVIPVLDLKEGLVVRGIAGRRAEYRPIESRHCADARPTTVARAMVEHFGFDQAYVADLDAIGGAEPAWNVYSDLVECGLRLIVDGGVGTLQRARSLSAFATRGQVLFRIVVGLESLAAPSLLQDMLTIITPERLVFSLDLCAGRPMTVSDAWESDALEIAMRVVRFGVRRIIVLDLASVGTEGGLSTLHYCRMLRRFDRRLEIITGGGVRGRSDMRDAAAHDVDGLLIASALHDGRLAPADVRSPQHS